MQRGRFWRRVLVTVCVLLAVPMEIATAAPARPAHAAINIAPKAHWPKTDLRSEQAYWAQRFGQPTAAQLAQWHAAATKIPQASHLPPVTHAGAVPAIPGGPSGAWHAMGPAPISIPLGGGQTTTVSGRVTAIAVDPTTSYPDMTVYIGTAGGGVWKTTDGGNTWIPLTDTQQYLSIGAIAIDPNNHNIIYAGTGEGNLSADSFPGLGVLKSTDGGATWTLYPLASSYPPLTFTTRILVNPRNSNQIYVATTGNVNLNQGNLYESNDGGVTYSLPSHGFPYYGNFQIDDLALNAATSPTTVYATVQGSGLYRSSDAGVTWTHPTTGLPIQVSSWNRSALAVAPSNPSVMYLVITSDPTNGDVYIPGVYNGGYYSTDGGTSWHQMTSLNQDFTSDGLGDGYAQGWYDLYLAVDPHNDETVYGGGIDIARTTNARGASGNWQNITSVYTSDNSNIAPNQHAMTFIPCPSYPCPAYLGNDGGVYFSNTLTAANPQSVVYTDENTAGLDISDYTGGDVGPNFVNQHLAIGGTQSDGTMLYTGNPIQPQVLGGNGGYAVIDRTAPHIMYAEHSGISLEKSSDGGASWTPATTGLGGNSGFYVPFIIDPSHDQHLLAGTDAVYESLNGGANWYQSSPVLTGSPYVPQYISAIAVNPSNPANVYVGVFNGGVSVTTNADSGAQASYTSVGVNFTQVSALAFDPADPSGNTLFATEGGASRPYCNGCPYVYMTTNGLAGNSATWNSLPAISAGVTFPVNSILVYYSGSTRVIVVGTEVGVFFTADTGAHWYALNNGLPNAPVTQLAMDSAETTLVAYTHGRGAWYIDIPETNGGTGDGVGVYRPSTHTFYLKNSLTTRPADYTDPLGNGTAMPVAGDWNGDGIDTVGLFNNGAWSLPASNAPGAPIAQHFIFGKSGDLPVLGDWLGQGHDGIGVFRPSTSTFYLRETVGAGPPDETISFGAPGDLPVAGDWTAQGYDTVGVYRPSQALFFLSNTRCTVCAGALAYTVAFGVAGDVPFTGDWTHEGKTGLGVFRPSNGLTYARNDATTTGYADFALVYGVAGDQPIAGHWNTAAPSVPSQPATTAAGSPRQRAT